MMTFGVPEWPLILRYNSPHLNIGGSEISPTFLVIFVCQF